ncbi:MAG: serine/threonine protein phosphatase [Lachnospiraceae bacterium]|nr:serine/threonine protein phosphatase [Lachnospiraceae bacterium]
MKNFILKYKHGIPMLVYLVIYLAWFSYVEKTVTKHYHVIHMAVDDYIPFCEVFIIPYLLWFLYVVVAVVLTMFTDKGEYYKLCTVLVTGMTIFLVISTLWPNGHHLRPLVMPRDNIFTQLIAGLYQTDTATNLWPSIHVYNSLAAHFAINRSKVLQKYPLVRYGSLILAISIILSTMLIKQHSVFDVLTAFILSAVMYYIVYMRNMQFHFRVSRKNKPQTN